MITLLSPAKSLDFTPTKYKSHSIPRLLHESEKLIKTLRNKPQKDIRSLMKISADLAKLNSERYKSFSTPFNLENAKQAVLAFDGDVYTGLDTGSMNANELKYADNHVRILSGLYGLLKPMDLIQPYRLEMGTRLKTRRGTNLYKFWGDQITNMINSEIEDHHAPFIINLASNEYFKAVDVKKLVAPVYTFDFLENRNGEYKFISFTAKKARGTVTRFIIDEKINDPEHIKAFDRDGYIYNEDLSSERKFVFTKE